MPPEYLPDNAHHLTFQDRTPTLGDVIRWKLYAVPQVACYYEGNLITYADRHRMVAGTMIVGGMPRDADVVIIPLEGYVPRYPFSPPPEPRYNAPVMPHTLLEDIPPIERWVVSGKAVVLTIIFLGLVVDLAIFTVWLSGGL